MLCCQCKRALSNTEEGLPPSKRNNDISRVITDNRSTRSSLVILQGTIPDVLEWTRAYVDEHHSRQEDGFAKLRREAAYDISTRCNMRIDLNDGTDWWKGEQRFWENVCGMVINFPGGGHGRNIFEAMRRYPSSILVFSGLRTVFGRYMAVGKLRIRRPPRAQNAIFLFSKNGNSRHNVKGWFEESSYSRMQELVIHLCAVAEYIFRCVYNALSKAPEDGINSDWFVSFLNQNLKEVRESGYRTELHLSNAMPLRNLTEDEACDCLSQSLLVAHSAVVEGAGTGGRKYGRKRLKHLERRRVKLSMLRRPLPEVLDAFASKMTTAINGITRGDLDIIVLQKELTQILRRVETIYTEVGASAFKCFLEKSNVSSREPNRLGSLRPYTYNPLSV